MSKRKPTLLDMQAELLLRKLRFYQSDLCAHKYTGMSVNCEGGIGSKNPALVHLIQKRLVYIDRVNKGRTELNDGQITWRGIRPTRHRSIAKLTRPPEGKIELTCPCCNELFVYRYRFGDEQYHLLTRTDYHAYNCILREDHGRSWNGDRRVNQYKQALRGRKADHTGSQPRR